MTWTPPAPEPCGPDCTCHTDAYPTGHAAQAIGDHDRRQREIDTELDRLRPCRCATSEAPAQCHCLPDTPSGRLPWTDRLPETPTYQTGRVPTDDGRSRPLPPVPEQSYPPGAQNLSVHTDRPGIIRRIWDAARKASR